MWRTVVVVAWLSTFVPSVVSAQAVYDNGQPTPGDFALASYPLTEAVQAEDFTLASPATVTGVRFFALERRDGFADSIFWSIRPNDAGGPAGGEVAGGLASAAAAMPLLGAAALLLKRRRRVRDLGQESAAAQRS